MRWLDDWYLDPLPTTWAGSFYACWRSLLIFLAFLTATTAMVLIFAFTYGLQAQ